jgi:hypothetical protein
VGERHLRSWIEKLGPAEQNIIWRYVALLVDGSERIKTSIAVELRILEASLGDDDPEDSPAGQDAAQPAGRNSEECHLRPTHLEKPNTQGPQETGELIVVGLMHDKIKGNYILYSLDKCQGVMYTGIR